jgi:hypothetical protein
MNQNTWQRACVWSGIVAPVLFFIGFITGHWLPPLSPSTSTAGIAEHYREHADGIRLGGVLIMISGMFYAAYTAVISGQIARVKKVHRTVVHAQTIGGAFACLTFLVPGMLMVVTAFRPERSPEITQVLNDFTWIFLVIPWPPFMVQNFAFAFAILSQDENESLFPRWLAYLNVWAPITFTPAVLLPFFKSGPFAWNGVFVLWIPAVVFVTQFVVNVVFLLRAVSSPEQPPTRTDATKEASHAELLVGDLGQGGGHR